MIDLFNTISIASTVIAAGGGLLYFGRLPAWGQLLTGLLLFSLLNDVVVSALHYLHINNHVFFDSYPAVAFAVTAFVVALTLPLEKRDPIYMITFIFEVAWDRLGAMDIEPLVFTGYGCTMMGVFVTVLVLTAWHNRPGDSATNTLYLGLAAYYIVGLGLWPFMTDAPAMLRWWWVNNLLAAVSNLILLTALIKASRQSEGHEERPVMLWWWREPNRLAA